MENVSRAVSRTKAAPAPAGQRKTWPETGWRPRCRHSPVGAAPRETPAAAAADRTPIPLLGGDTPRQRRESAGPPSRPGSAGTHWVPRPARHPSHHQDGDGQLTCGDENAGSGADRYVVPIVPMEKNAATAG